MNTAQNSSFEDDTQCLRELTSMDVDQALNTLNFNERLSRKRTISSDNEIAMVTAKEECDCCRLLRTNPSSRLFLPLARRSRSNFSTQSPRLLCSNCIEIKRQQQIDILQKENKSKSNHIYQTIINFDISSQEQQALSNHQYEPTQMLVWKINTSDGTTINLSYDTDSLSENEKKILLEETIQKLQIVLNNQPTTTTDQDHMELTYRTLQTTINILSSSRNSM